VLLAAAVFINFVDRGSLATASPLLKDELGLSNAEIGVLLSAFFWSYAPLQPVAGLLAQRFDVRYVLPGGLSVWAIATALTGSGRRGGCPARNHRSGEHQRDCSRCDCGG
jgi:sugar phosphate permease